MPQNSLICSGALTYALGVVRLFWGTTGLRNGELPPVQDLFLNSRVNEINNLANLLKTKGIKILRFLCPFG